MKIRPGILALSLLLMASTSRANDLKPETLQAWQEYIQSTDSQMRQRLNQGAFLRVDEAPDHLASLLQGEILVEPVTRNGHPSSTGAAITSAVERSPLMPSSSNVDGACQTPTVSFAAAAAVPPGAPVGDVLAGVDVQPASRMTRNATSGDAPCHRLLLRGMRSGTRERHERALCPARIVEPRWSTV